jgi:hypothetical protein
MRENKTETKKYFFIFYLRVNEALTVIMIFFSILEVSYEP